MAYESLTKDARLTLVLPAKLKIRLTRIATEQNRRVSALVRESIEEKLDRLEQKQFEEKMREAYLDLAEENLRISEQFEYSDAESLDNREG